MIKFILSSLRWSGVFGLALDCSSACSSPAAPDLSATAAATEKAAEYGYKAAGERLAFDKAIYDESTPYRTKLQQSAIDLAEQQKTIAADNQAFAKSQQDRYTDTFIPVEDQMVKDANEYGTEADQERGAGIASNQVQVQAAGQREAASRRLESLGIRPDSGAAVGANSSADVITAAASANAGNAARISARDKGIAMRTGVAAFGRGNTGAAVAANNTAITAGNSSTGQLTAATNAALPAAGLVDGGYGQQQAAASAASQGAIGYGGLLNTGYGIQMQGYNAGMAADAAGSAGMGSMIGGVAMAGATMY